MPTRLCSDYSEGHGCPNPATGRGKCDEHRKQTERERSRERRADSHKKFYDTKRWAMVSRHQLFISPLCERCGRVAQHVHHDPRLEELLATGRNPYAAEFLHSVCKPCHSYLTLLEQREAGGGSAA